MVDDTYHVLGSHPAPSGYVFRSFVSGSGAPTSTDGVAPDTIYIDEDTGDTYKLESGAWVQLYTGGGGGGGGGGGVTYGDSDPVADPGSGPKLFVRNDIARVLRWDGAAWGILFSE